MAVSDLPDWGLSPIRQQAWQAMQVRTGPPVVDIRCGGIYHGHSCGNLLGGAWVTRFGTVVAAAHLTSRDSSARYMEAMRDATERDRLLREQGAFSGDVEEETVMLIVGGERHAVPGAVDHDHVRCARHGSWSLDLDGVAKKIEVARVTRRRETFGAIPPMS